MEDYIICCYRYDDSYGTEKDLFKLINEESFNKQDSYTFWSTVYDYYVEVSTGYSNVPIVTNDGNPLHVIQVSEEFKNYKIIDEEYIKTKFPNFYDWVKEDIRFNPGDEPYEDSKIVFVSLPVAKVTHKKIISITYNYYSPVELTEQQNYDVICELSKYGEKLFNEKHGLNISILSDKEYDECNECETSKNFFLPVNSYDITKPEKPYPEFFAEYCDELGGALIYIDNFGDEKKVHYHGC